jgi:serine/threonine protein kinase
MRGLLEVISYLHTKGIMHIDFNLKNIMVKKDINAPD